MQAVLCNLAPDALASYQSHGRTTGREPTPDVAADASGSEDADAMDHRTFRSAAFCTPTSRLTVSTCRVESRASRPSAYPPAIAAQASSIAAGPDFANASGRLARS